MHCKINISLLPCCQIFQQWLTLPWCFENHKVHLRIFSFISLNSSTNYNQLSNYDPVLWFVKGKVIKGDVYLSLLSEACKMCLFIFFNLIYHGVSYSAQLMGNSTSVTAGAPIPKTLPRKLNITLI